MCEFECGEWQTNEELSWVRLCSLFFGFFLKQKRNRGSCGAWIAYSPKQYLNFLFMRQEKSNGRLKYRFGNTRSGNGRYLNFIYAGWYWGEYRHRKPATIFTKAVQYNFACLDKERFNSAKLFGFSVQKRPFLPMTIFWRSTAIFCMWMFTYNLKHFFNTNPTSADYQPVKDS